MKNAISHTLMLFTAAMIVMLAATPAIQADTLYGGPSEVGKVEMTHQESNAGAATKVFSRRGAGVAKTSELPSFTEVPHGAPQWADHYASSYFDRSGQLSDVYELPGLTIGASTDSERV